MKLKEKYKHLDWLIDAFYNHEWYQPYGLDKTWCLKIDNVKYEFSVYCNSVKINSPYKYDCGFFESRYLLSHWKQSIKNKMTKMGE